MEYKVITSKNFIGTYFGHMVTISDLGAGPQSRPLPLVLFKFTFEVKFQIINKQVAGAGFGGLLMSLKIHASRKIV